MRSAASRVSLKVNSGELGGVVSFEMMDVMMSMMFGGHVTRVCVLLSASVFLARCGWAVVMGIMVTGCVVLGAVSWFSVRGSSSVCVGTGSEVLGVCMSGVVCAEGWEDPPSAGVHGTCGWYFHSGAHETVFDDGSDRFLDVVLDLPRILSSSASGSIVDVVGDGVAALEGAVEVSCGVVDMKGVVDVEECGCDV